MLINIQSTEIKVSIDPLKVTKKVNKKLPKSYEKVIKKLTKSCLSKNLKIHLNESKHKFFCIKSFTKDLIKKFVL